MVEEDDIEQSLVLNYGLEQWDGLLFCLEYQPSPPFVRASSCLRACLLSVRTHLSHRRVAEVTQSLTTPVVSGIHRRPWDSSHREEKGKWLLVFAHFIYLVIISYCNLQEYCSTPY